MRYRGARFEAEMGVVNFMVGQWQRTPAVPPWTLSQVFGKRWLIKWWALAELAIVLPDPFGAA